MNMHHMKLVSETEKLNMRSEFEVKVDILQKENCYMKEERKKMMRDMREMAGRMETEEREKGDEVEKLKKELMEQHREERTKDQLLSDHSVLKIQNKTLKG